MRRLEKRQVLIFILVSVLVLASLYGLSYSITEPNQGKPFSFTSSKESPLHNSETYLAPLPLWQFNGSNVIFAQSATEISSNGVLTRNTGNSKHALCYYRCEIVPKHKEISFRIDSFNVPFKLINLHICQYLDIPPPALASL